MELILTLIILLPLAGAAVNTLLPFRSYNRTTGIVAGGSVLLSFVLSVYLFATSGYFSNEIHSYWFEWMKLGQLRIPFSFTLDALSGLFVLVITGIGFLIHWYSTGYMHEDKSYARFFIYLNLFIFFMLVLVLASNYALMFVGWEGVGLCSFLLIGFWYKNEAYTNAANKAFIMNRIGDLGFLLGVMMIGVHFGTLNFDTIFSRLYEMEPGVWITTIAILLFIGAIGKSAQLPLFTWLPDAMAGPTPVSALIHAATMVTAGIYLLARSSAIYVMAPSAMDLVLYTGLATSLVAALIAIYQYDIKKVLAYSTVSQLGLMFAAIGAGGFNAAVFHVITHAAFKALLFLGAGSVIHGLNGEQDMRKMGGLKSAMPKTFATFLIATIAISGIPPFSGFFSKDQILATLFESKGVVIYAIGLLISAITTFYMFRLLFLTFYGKSRNENHGHETPSSMLWPLYILASLSAIAGLAGLPHFTGMPHLLDNILSLKTFVYTPHMPVATELILIGITLLVIMISILLGYRLYVKREITFKEEPEMVPLEKAAYRKFYFDEMYGTLVTKNMDRIAAMLDKWMDQRFFENTVSGSGKTVRELGLQLRQLQSGNVGNYFFAMVIAMSVVLIYFILQ